MVRVVTAPPPGWTAQAVRRTVRRTTRRLAWRTGAALALARCTTAGRSGGFWFMWTAPPPMMAPPQVQAQSFARAIRTDIPDLSSRPFPLRSGEDDLPPSRRSGCRKDMQTVGLSASALTTFRQFCGRSSRLRPRTGRLTWRREGKGGEAWLIGRRPSLAGALRFAARNDPAGRRTTAVNI
jgi:hypothetical protein